MSTAPSTSPLPPPGGPPGAPKSGGGKVILWIVGIFVGFLFLIMASCAALGFYFATHKAKQFASNPAYSATKFAVAANPDLETVSSNDSAGTITVRDRRTGKVSTLKIDAEKKIMVITDENGKSITMTLDAVRNKLVLTDEKGKTASISADTQGGSVEIKSPEATVKMSSAADKAPDWVPVYPGASPQVTFSASDDKTDSGSFVFTTKDSVDKVLAYYADSLNSGGFKTSNTTNNSEGKATGMLSGNTDGDQRSVVVIAADDTDGTKVSVKFSNKK